MKINIYKILYDFNFTFINYIVEKVKKLIKNYF